jgi:hypothetical protein
MQIFLMRERTGNWNKILSARRGDMNLVPGTLWNPEAHYRVHKGPPFVPKLSEMNRVHSFPNYFPKIHSNIILSSTIRSSNWSRLFRFSNQNIVCISRISLRATCPDHFIHLIIFGEAYEGVTEVSGLSR